MFKLGILCIGASFFLSGCYRTSTDPYPAFMQVQYGVQERTGDLIHWNKKTEDPCEIRDYIEQTLNEQLSMDQVIKIAILNNKHLQAIYEELGLAQAQLVQAGLFKNPVFDFSLRYDDGFGTGKIIEMGIVQNFLDVLLKPLKRILACAELEITKNRVVGDVMEVIAETKMAFYSFQAAEQALILIKENLAADDAAYDAATRLHTAGNINQLTLAVKRSLFEQSKMDVADSEMEVVDAREKLNVMMGLWGQQTDWEIVALPAEIPKSVPEFLEIENHIVANSLDLRNARKQICAAAARIGIDTAEIVFPELGIGVDSEREDTGNWFVGPQFAIAIPLFDWGQAQRAAGHAELSQLCNEYSALAVEVRSAARLLSFRLWNVHRKSRYFEDVLLPLSEEVTAQTLLQLNAMQVGVFEVLSAKQQEIETRRKAVLSYRDYWVARTELELLMNGRMLHKMRMK